MEGSAPALPTKEGWSIRHSTGRRFALWGAVVAALVIFAAGLTPRAAQAAFGDNFGLVPGSLFVGTCDLPAVTGGEATPAEAVERRDCHPASALVPQTATPVTQAGAHPDLTTSFEFNPTDEPGYSGPYPDGNPLDVIIDLPPGLIGNPEATPKCSGVDAVLGLCPVETQVGTLELRLSEVPDEPPADGERNPRCSGIAQPDPAMFPQFSFPDGPTTLGGGTPGWYTQVWGQGARCRVPIYNVEPGFGEVASLQFVLRPNVIAVVQPVVRTDSDFGIQLRVNHLPQYPGISKATATVWGVPGDPDHDAFRFQSRLAEVGAGQSPGQPWPSGVHVKPFMTNPTSCDSGAAQRTVLLRTRSSQNRDVWKTYEQEIPARTGCEDVPFAPKLDVAVTTTAADAASGLDVELEVPQKVSLPPGLEGDPTGAAAYWNSPDGLGTSNLDEVVITLPEGMAVNPAAADGLQGCSDAQVGLVQTGNPPLFDKRDPFDRKLPAAERCPAGSKIGTVEVYTPLLPSSVAGKPNLTGEVVLGTPKSTDPQSGDMFRLFLLLRNRERGLVVKVAGSAVADPQTGQLTATFDNGPQVAFETLHLKLKGGPRGLLATPQRCGTYITQTKLTGWNGKTVTGQTTFNISQDSKGRPCPDSMGFQPTLRAGVESPEAGSHSPFHLLVARQDGDSELKAIKSIRLPDGLLGNVGSVPLCNDARAAAGTCSEESKVGHVQASLGAGASPLWVPLAGRSPTAVYLAGPYRGAPYSLSIVVPAQAGPFDLGRVVVRSALHVDERTTQIATGVDETRLIDNDGTVTEVAPEALPRILKGIELRQREIRVVIDRKDFIVNPTDCSMKAITAEIYSYGNHRADVGNRFRAADCPLLGFRPRFAARILNKGRRSTLRSFHPRTRFTVVPRRGDANIGGARVVLPSSTILDQSNIGTTCTRARMAADSCPKASVVGYARAWSPLLRKTVEGPVYLAANGGVRPLPDLAAVLDGEIRVVLVGEITTNRFGGKARLQNTFRVVPDAPVTRFVLTMQGGARRGLLVNSTDLCRSKERGVAVFVGQNGKRHGLRPRIATAFKGCGKVRRQAARRRAAR